MQFGLLYEMQRPFKGTDIDWNTLYKEMRSSSVPWLTRWVLITCGLWNTTSSQGFPVRPAQKLCLAL